MIAAQARHQFILGFGERLRERAIDFVRDPLGGAGDLPDPDFFTTRGLGMAALDRAGELWDYARFLRTLPPRTAIMVASHDAGRASADVAVEVGQAALRRRLARGASGRTAPPTGDRVPPRAP